jgi:hypothetical protein
LLISQGQKQAACNDEANASNGEPPFAEGFDQWSD